MKSRAVLASLALTVGIGIVAVQAQDQGTAYRPGPGIENPVLVRRVLPKYTQSAMQAKIEGQVELEAIVRADGTVGDVRVVKSLDAARGLDDNAVSAASQWMFKPGTREGKPVPVIVTLVLDFHVKPGPGQDIPQPIQSDDEFLKGVYRPGPGVSAPILQTHVEPKYTAPAMRDKIQGQVLVEAVVEADGSVNRARVQRSLDAIDGLDAKALEAVKQWTFIPGTVDGKAVPVVVQLSLDFRLH